MTAKYDVFLSYSGADRETVNAISKLLTAQGVSSFLDRDHLVPGQPWPQALEDGLKTSSGVVVFLGPSGLGPWQKREMGFALDRQVQEERVGRTFPVIPVLLPGSDPVPGFLFLNHQVDLREDPLDADALKALIDGVHGKAAATDEIPSVLCPYQGLDVFEESDAAFFCGREDFSSRLLESALASNFVVLIGPSGSGKSSVARAGLLPLLRRQRPPAQTWDVALFKPGDDPFGKMAAALLPLLEPDLRETDRLVEGQRLGKHLAEGEVRLEAIVQRLLEKSEGTDRLLLLVDQFEELFTLAPESVRTPFVDALLQARERSALTLMMTLRADFYSSALSLNRELSDALEQGVINLGPMRREELERAIVKPAERVGLTLEPGLVEMLLADVDNQAGALPLLQHALTRLWKERLQGQRLLTIDAYKKIGGLSGALDQYASEIYQNFDDAEKKACRRIFLRLTQPVEGHERTARRVLRSDLDGLEQEDVVSRVIKKLADERLLTTEGDPDKSESYVEMSHEALIKGWSLLRGWIESDREYQQVLELLRQDAREWQNNGGKVAYLYHDERLTGAEKIVKDRLDELSELERKFLVAASLVREKKRKRRKRRTRLIELTAVVGLFWGIITSILYSAADTAQKDAVRKLVDIHWVGGVKEMTREDNADSAMKAAHHFMQVAELTVDDERKNAYLAGRLLTSNIQLVDILEQDHRYLRARFFRDRQRLLLWRKDGTVLLWKIGDPNSPEPVELPVKHEKAIVGVVFSEDESRILTWDDAERVCIWDSDEGRRLDCFRTETAIANAVFNHRHDRVLILGEDNSARVWTVQSGTGPDLTLRHDLADGEKIREAAFSSDDERILTWGDDHIVYVWNAEKAEDAPLLKFQQEKEGLGISQAMFNKAGDRIFSANDQTAKILDSRTGKTLAEFQHEGRITGIDTNRDESRVLTWGEDNSARLWSSDGKALLNLSHQGSVNGAAFFCGEKWLLTWSADGTARLWDSRTGDPVQPFMIHAGPVTGADFSCGDSGQADRILTRDENGSVHVWDSAGWQMLDNILALQSPIRKAAFNRSGSQILILDVFTDSSSGVEIQKKEGEVWRPLMPATDSKDFQGADFSQDGSSVLTWDQEGKIRVWNSESGQLLMASRFRHVSLAHNFEPAISRDGSHLVSQAEVGSLRISSTVSDESLSIPTADNQFYLGAIFSRNGGRLLTWSSDGSTRVWDGRTGEMLADSNSSEGVFYSGGVFTPDGSRVITWSDSDGSLWLWDYKDEQPQVLSSKHDGPVQGVVFSDDGRRFLSWSRFDENARVWSSRTGHSLHLLEHQAGINGGSFSGDGAQVMTWARDNTVRLWDQHSGKLLTILRHKRSYQGVSGAAFSPDDQRILVWGDDQARLWNLDVDGSGQARYPTLELERHTGTYLDELNAIQVLSREDWYQKQQDKGEDRGLSGRSTWARAFSRIAELIPGL